MKKLFTISLTALLAFPIFATSTTSTSPILGTERDSDMIEAQEEYEGPSIERMEDQWHEDIIDQERMEEAESESAIDYTDRTRTDRERKALNTGSNASDDR